LEDLLRNKLQEIELGDILHYFDETTSTNDVAKHMVANNHAHGTMIVAKSQVKGRGTYGRSFFSKQATGIYISFIIDENKWHFNRPDLATIFTTVAVSEAIHKVTKKLPRLKWVNDLYLNNLKIGGILTETVIKSQKLVIGIGVNVSTKKVDFPQDLQNVAGSLGLVDDDEIKTAIITEIAQNMLHASKLSDFNECLRLYRLRSIILDHDIVKVKIGQDLFDAFVLDINDYGQLVVRKESGEIVILNCGEASIKM